MTMWVKHSKGHTRRHYNSDGHTTYSSGRLMATAAAAAGPLGIRAAGGGSSWAPLDAEWECEWCGENMRGLGVAAEDGVAAAGVVNVRGGVGLAAEAVAIDGEDGPLKMNSRSRPRTTPGARPSPDICGLCRNVDNGLGSNVW